MLADKVGVGFAGACETQPMVPRCMLPALTEAAASAA